MTKFTESLGTLPHNLSFCIEEVARNPVLINEGTLGDKLESNAEEYNKMVKQLSDLHENVIDHLESRRDHAANNVQRYTKAINELRKLEEEYKIAMEVDKIIHPDNKVLLAFQYLFHRRDLKKKWVRNKNGHKKTRRRKKVNGVLIPRNSL